MVSTTSRVVEINHILCTLCIWAHPTSNVYICTCSLPSTPAPLFIVTLVAEALAVVIVVVSAEVLFAPGTLVALRSLSGGHVCAGLSETLAHGRVRVELDLGTETVLLLLPPLELETLVAPPAASAVVLLAELVANLPSTPATAKLASLLVSRVEVAADDALVELCARNVAQACNGLGVEVVFDECKATWRPGS